MIFERLSLGMIVYILFCEYTQGVDHSAAGGRIGSRCVRYSISAHRL